MVKNLRSFIQEKIPLELRLEFDKLSRRRDLRGEAKPEKIIQLFREYEVGELSQLGPGTNRYGMRMDGFVIKIATDNDGKIDNLKEFKMAKILFPNVPRTYEVSKNGLLLIAEYGQPFQSYAEMLKYAEPIREILQRWSDAGFLIGDAGICSKNYANWALRVGTNELMCIDFAYVYDVTSDLFICSHCHTNSMLLPDKDFVKLICPNPACQKVTLFEDIRTMISKRQHLSQIGDLTEEGYLMTTSNVMTELTENRSNYLVKMRSKGNKPKKAIAPSESNETSETSEDKEDNEKSNNSIEEEDIDMFKNEVVVQGKLVVDLPAHPFDGLVVEGISVTASDDAAAIVQARTAATEDQPDNSSDDGVAFTATFDPEMSTVVPDAHSNVIMTNGTVTAIGDLKPGDEFLTAGETPARVENVYEAAGGVSAEDEESVDTVDNQSSDAEQVGTDESTSNIQFKYKFCNESNKAVSIFANKIAAALRTNDVFNELRGSIRNKKLYAEEFYNTVSTAVFKSIVEFLGFVEVEVPNPKSEGTHREFTAVYDTVNSDEYRASSAFAVLSLVERVYNTRSVNSQATFGELVHEYNRIYVSSGSVFMLPDELVDMCGSKLGAKLNLQSHVVSLFEAALCALWDTDDVYIAYTGSINNDEQEDADDEEPEGEVVDISGSYPIENDGLITPIDGEDDESDQEYEDVDDEESSDYSEDGFLTIEIYQDDDYDIIKIKIDDPFGLNTIPLYGNLDSVTSDMSDKAIDIRNGCWDWLAHMVPDVMFRTKTPETYLECNASGDDLDENQGHCAIIGIDESGDYIMGIFVLAGVYVVDDDFEFHPLFNMEILKKLNRFICDSIADTCISHRRKSMDSSMLIHDEEWANQNWFTVSITDEDDSSDNSYENPEDNISTVTADDEVSEAEAAAVSALMDDADVQDAVELEQEVEAPPKKATGSKPTPKRDEKGRFVPSTNSDDEDGSVTVRRRNSKKK